MTRAEAAKRVGKLRNLAARAGTPAEAATARQRADDLVKQFILTETELSIGARARAFDEVLDRLDAFVKANRDKLPSPILDIASKIKETSEEEKASTLTKLVNATRFTAMFLGGNKTVAGLKEIVDSALRNQDVVI